MSAWDATGSLLRVAGLCEYVAVGVQHIHRFVARDREDTDVSVERYRSEVARVGKDPGITGLDKSPV